MKYTGKQLSSSLVTDQQNQARANFTETADAWQHKSEDEREYSLIQNRNSIVLGKLLNFPQHAKFLDIGCGTGQLAIQAACHGYHATGIDYSETMIKHCIDNAMKVGASVQFKYLSIFDFPTTNKTFDLISALGFIEYLSQPQLALFFQKTSEMLPRGGKLLIGTRNRLFNVTSLNQFTNIERELGNFDNLLRQAMAFQSVSSTDKNFDFLEEFASIEAQPEVHPHTGVKVDTRYQYSPGEIYARLKMEGYKLDRIYPVHYHAFPPSVKEDYIADHEKVARFVQEHASSDMRLIPWCSTLIFSVRRGNT